MREVAGGGGGGGDGAAVDGEAGGVRAGLEAARVKLWRREGGEIEGEEEKEEGEFSTYDESSRGR